jgi:hypothetical protein
LITEKKEGKNRFYSIDSKSAIDIVDFFEVMYNFKLNLLKEYVENKEMKKWAKD